MLFPAALLSAALLAAPARAYTGVASLTEGEVDGLTLLVSSDASAKAAFDELRRQADEGLKQAPKPVVVLSSATLGDVPDFDRARALALVYGVTKDRKYFAQAKAYVLAWAGVGFPGGEPLGDTLLEPLIEAYDLLRLDFKTDERRRVDLWLRSVGEAEMASAAAPGGSAPDSSQSHRLKTIGLIGYTIRVDRLAKYALEGFEKQIGDNLRSDGASVDFEKRGDPSAQAYDLEALLRLAIALHRAGHESYGFAAPNGATLRRAVKFLKSFADGSKSARKFDPKRAEAAIALAEYFDPRLLGLVVKLEGGASKTPPLRVVLNAATQR
jgi:hypothetical protein